MVNLVFARLIHLQTFLFNYFNTAKNHDRLLSNMALLPNSTLTLLIVTV